MVVYIYVKYVNKLRVVNNGLDLVLIWMMLEYPGYLFCAFVFKLQLLFRKFMFFFIAYSHLPKYHLLFIVYFVITMYVCVLLLYIYILFIFMRCLKM